MNNVLSSIMILGSCLLLVPLACTKSRTNRTSEVESLTMINMVPVENNTDLEFRIQADKVRYSKGEPIFLQMSIVNIGSKSVFINKRFIINSPHQPKEAGTGEVYLIVTSPTGDTLSFNAFLEVGYPTNNDYIKLEPKKMVRNDNKQDINEFYEFGENSEYKLTAYYYNYFNKGITPQPWQGKIKSNTIVIQIQ